MLVGNYYGVEITIAATAGSEYFSLTVGSAGELNGAGMTSHAQQGTTFVSLSPVSLQFQVPAASALTVGTTVVTSSDRVTGSVAVSPAMPGDVTLKLYGAAKLLGTWSLPAGQTEGQFDFPVNAADAIPQMHAGSFLETTARRSFH